MSWTYTGRNGITPRRCSHYERRAQRLHPAGEVCGARAQARHVNRDKRETPALDSRSVGDGRLEIARRCTRPEPAMAGCFDVIQ